MWVTFESSPLSWRRVRAVRIEPFEHSLRIWIKILTLGFTCLNRFVEWPAEPVSYIRMAKLDRVIYCTKVSSEPDER
ncbi:hypothetical protein GGE67_006169 [Rhizobium leucaenae]|nr:hypothetical protein [Rhizobium leucaenae]